MTTSQVQLTLVKFWHALAGLYFWEYFTNLDYEWRVFRGHQPYRWTIWIYSLARLAALMSVIIFIVIMDITTQIDCQFWNLFSSILLLLSSTTASLLVVFRSIAIWNRNKVVVTLTIIAWGTSVGFHLHNITLMRSVWFSTQLGCAPAKSNISTFSYIVAIIADMALLLIILTGLLVMRRRIGGTFGLTRVLWKQGIIWLVIAFAAEIPLLLFITLHLNDQLHNLFVSPNHIVWTITATRVHRALIDSTSGSPNVARGSRLVSNHAFSKTNPTDTPSIALDRIEVAIHKAVEQHPTGRTSNDDSSTIISTKSTCPLESAPPSPEVPAYPRH